MLQYIVRLSLSLKGGMRIGQMVLVIYTGHKTEHKKCLRFSQAFFDVLYKFNYFEATSLYVASFTIVMPSMPVLA